MANIPDDVLSNNIFIRLRTKQLAQMRCLSKPWNAFLSQSSFIKSHLDRSIHKNDETLLVFRRDFRFNKKPFTAHHTESPHLRLTNLIKLPVVNALSIGACKIIGSVNGLICFLHKLYPTRVIYIWNPSLSAILPLPPYIPSCGFKSSFRFGSDPKTDDYKIVKLKGTSLRPPTLKIASYSGTYIEVREWLGVEVYSTRKGCWEIINQSFPSNIKRVFDKDEVYVDGKDGYVHWVGSRDGELRQTIVAFDLGVETFFEISLPDSIQDHELVCRQFALGVLDGKLCAMSGFIIGGECDLWVMNEYGVAESWVKHHVFSKDFDIQMPFGFTSNNKLLYLSNTDHLALYDPAIAKVKFFKIRLNFSEITKTVQYFDSLVWIAPVAN